MAGCDFKRKLKVGEVAVVFLYIRDFFLNKFRNCLCSNQVWQYFKCPPPSLALYMRHKVLGQKYYFRANRKVCIISLNFSSSSLSRASCFSLCSSLSSSHFSLRSCILRFCLSTLSSLFIYQNSASLFVRCGTSSCISFQISSRATSLDCSISPNLSTSERT